MWSTSRLEDLSAHEPNSLVDGPFGSDLKTSDYLPAGVPLIRIQNVKPNHFLAKDTKYVSVEKARRLSRHDYKPGDLVMTKLGDPCGVACVVPREAGIGLIVADIVRFRGDPRRIDHGFLSHFINSPSAMAWVDRQAKGSTRQRVNLSNFKKLPVPLPPLSEQRRIAELLDRADALRAKRRAALAQLDTLTQSIFLDMFGDPATNPKRWPWRSLKQCTKGIQIGPFGSLLHQGDYVSGGVPLINPMHIQDGAIVPDHNQSVTAGKHATLALYHLRQGDVIMGRRGEMGRCAIVGPEHDGFVCGTGSLFIRPDLDSATTLYLAAVLSSAAIRRKLERASLGATLPNLNRGIVENLEVPVPGMSHQRDFANRVEAVEMLKSAQIAALAESDVLFASLQHRAFRGQL
jgi:type I restriction enzyme S subunit